MWKLEIRRVVAKTDRITTHQKFWIVRDSISVPFTNHGEISHAKLQNIYGVLSFAPDFICTERHHLISFSSSRPPLQATEPVWGGSRCPSLCHVLTRHSLRSLGEFGAPLQILTGFVSWQRYCTASSRPSGRQPNFAALNRGCHLCWTGRPSRWALAYISSVFFFTAP